MINMRQVLTIILVVSYLMVSVQGFEPIPLNITVGVPFTPDTVKNISDAYLYHKTIEFVGVILFDNHNLIKGVYVLSQGNKTRVSIPAADIVDFAVSKGATGFMDWHNHPAPALYGPSESDKKMWIQIGLEADRHGIVFRDSVIVLSRGFFDRVQDKIIWFPRNQTI